MKIQILEATSPSIVSGSIFNLGETELNIGIKIHVKTELADYIFEIEQIEVLENNKYKVSNSNNIVIFRIISEQQ